MAIGIPAAQLAALRKGMAAKPRKPIDTAAVDLLAFHVKAQRLPAPDREYRFAAMAVGGTGAGVKERLRKARLRDWRFDFAWPDQMVALEMDGGGFVGGRHGTGPGIEKDCEKYSNAAAMGWRLLRVTPRQVKSGQAVDWIGKALEIRS